MLTHEMSNTDTHTESEHTVYYFQPWLGQCLLFKNNIYMTRLTATNNI